MGFSFRLAGSYAASTDVPAENPANAANDSLANSRRLKSLPPVTSFSTNQDCFVSASSAMESNRRAERSKKLRVQELTTKIAA
jgi:hypothetical protein